MGRKPKDRRLEILRDNLLERISSEEEPGKLKELLSCYKQVISIIEHQDEQRAKRKKLRLAMPR